jgi:undecaprenyl-diphosphatase
VVALVLGLVAFVLVGWGVGELWTSIGASADLRAVRWVADQRTAALTDIARVVTWLGSSAVLVPLAAIACLALERHGLRREAIVIAVSLGGAIVLWHVVKGLVRRARPPVEHLAHVTGTSFPSGHSTQAGAFWLSLVLVAPAAGASRTMTRAVGGVALTIVVIVACSRVYLGVHYPGDVVAGVLLGGGWAWFVSRCVGRTGAVA